MCYLIRNLYCSQLAGLEVKSTLSRSVQKGILKGSGLYRRLCLEEVQFLDCRCEAVDEDPKDYDEDIIPLNVQVFHI